MEGNARFVSHASRHPNMSRERRSVTSPEGRHLSPACCKCSDSRVPVELIVDCGTGDVFVVRVAGNVLGLRERGSIEYAVDHRGACLFVVLGHSKCGAVRAVLQKNKSCQAHQALTRSPMVIPRTRDASPQFTAISISPKLLMRARGSPLGT